MFIVSVLFYLYFLVLLMFCFINHSVYYCGLLVVGSLICSFICYAIFGFSWYSILFCLVYIGGIYVLFVFVSVFSPNNSCVTYFKLDSSFMYLLFVSLFVGSFLIWELLKMEFSSFLCSGFEGLLYVVMSMTLLFGFLVIGIISSIKGNYCR